MNGFDLSTISNCYYGQSACSAIYLGSTKIWPTTPAHDYSQDYFTIVSTSNNNTIGWKGSNSSLLKGINVSTNNGTTWIFKMPSTNGTTLATLNNGDKLYIKATNSTYATSSSIYHYFTFTGNFEVEGNIMSLVYGDNFIGQTVLNDSYNFCKLFYNNTYLTNAENLVLPATTLTYGTYYNMFRGCTNLTKSPKSLPALAVVGESYSSMFQDCTILTAAPEIKATTTGQNSCFNMFYNCTSLTKVYDLYITTFSGVQSCWNMFYGCSSLTKAPALPATTLANFCYQNMFRNCTSLTTAPTLPATTLTLSCYSRMFNGCSSLNYVKCLATDISASNCTLDWLLNTAATGTFVKDTNTTWSSGTSGIPSGWTIQNA